MGQSTKRTWRYYLRQTIGVSLVLGLLCALLLPAFFQVCYGINKMHRGKNLRDIGLAIHRAYDQKVMLSQAITRPNGRPLLSWRVAILSYLDDPVANDLYKQFKLDEPWDSPHNYALLSKMPAVYQSAGRDLPAHHTLIKVFVTAPSYEKGKYRTLWPASGPSHFKEVISSLADPVSSTILAAEIGIPVPWTKPEDIIIDETIENDSTDLDFQAAMDSRFAMAFHAVFADASVRTLRLSNPSSKTNKKLLRPYLGYKDGETVDDGVFD